MFAFDFANLNYNPQLY